MITALVDLLAAFYQAGNLEQMEAVARSMLAAMPDDLVALQFLGLALYLSGRSEAAYRAFARVAERSTHPQPAELPTTCEDAASVSYREATRPHSGLADGWLHIGRLLGRFGFRRPAAQARLAARAARGAPPAAYPRRSSAPG